MVSKVESILLYCSNLSFNVQPRRVPTVLIQNSLSELPCSHLRALSSKVLMWRTHHTVSCVRHLCVEVHLLDPLDRL